MIVDASSFDCRYVQMTCAAIRLGWLVTKTFNVSAEVSVHSLAVSGPSCCCPNFWMERQSYDRVASRNIEAFIIVQVMQGLIS